MGKNHDIPVGKHDLFAAQEIKKAVAASYDSYAKPKEEASPTRSKSAPWILNFLMSGWKILISSWSKTMIRKYGPRFWPE